MAKLLIFRGETKHAEVELTDQTVRIGRSPQDDIVLPDPSKGVSRTHAEIRFDGGRYVLADHQSQNGVWVAGSRVSSVVLERDVVASIGPYRLMMEVPAAGPVRATDTQSEVIERLEHLTGLPLAADGQAAEKPAPQPRVPGPPAARRWYQRPGAWAAIGAAALLIAASGFGVYRFLQPRQPTFDLEAARAMIVGGNCQQALVEHIEPALRANPSDGTALELKRQCTAPPPAPEPPVEPPVAPPPPTAAQQLADVETLMAAKECQKALEKINEVLGTDPNNERAKELFAQANACLAPPSPVPRVPADPLAARRPPSEGGLDPLPKESQKDYLKRVDAMRERYDNAVSLLQKRAYVQAAREFDQIRKEVPTGYLELAQRLDAARSGMKDDAKRSLDAARAAEDRGDFDAATDAYRRAHDLDPGIQVDLPLQRISDQKLLLGRRRCSEGQVEFSYGNNAAAAAAFQEVLKLLPPSEPCYATAKERLAQLRK